MTAAKIHATALIEEGVALGSDSAVWDNVHIRAGARLGRSCIVGEKTYIAQQVEIGDFVKINAQVYVCAQVTIEDFVMIAAHAVFTNDVYPRAGNVTLTGLETSDVTDETLATRVGRGATIGANATIGPGLNLGEFCMVGMGAVVTKDVAPHVLVVGNPARPVGYVCHCGSPLPLSANQLRAECPRCQRSFALEESCPRLLHDPHAR